MIFPALAISIPKAAKTAKLLRSSILNEMNKDYVRTAYSRGNSRWAVLRDHVLRNAMLPVITYLAMSLADTVAGSIIVEQVFALPHSSFDIITMWHVLEHIDDLKYFSEQLYKLLAKDGRLVIAVPNYMSFDALYYTDKWAAFDVPRHLNHFHKESLQHIFVNRFILEKIYPLKWDAYYISMMSEKFVGNTNSFINGIKIGSKSNKKAKKTGEYSSLIYVFRKI